MPKVLARDPAWLSRPSPGFQLFRPEERSQTYQVPDADYEGPTRKIAHRGTEVFVAVGNELRWADVALLKDAGEGNTSNETAEQAYRVLKTPVSRPVTQLTVSPSGDFIAILTSHTCHVAILPASSHLRSGDTSPLRLKTFQLGPTAHVLEQAPLVSAIWHPLSPYGHCLITTTKDSCVRMWELDRDNRATFDEPALAVDLKKLVNASSAQADLSASKYGASKGFSPESESMIAAAACFGGQGSSEEHGWANMTFWVAMTEGDVYALCPFLPSRWRAPATLLPSLSTSVVAKTRALNGGERVSESERRLCDQQCKWLAEIDGQDPSLMPGEGDFDTIEVYSRPDKPGAIPKLQGPFYLEGGLDSGEITDIHVVAPKIDDGALYGEEYEDEEDEEGLSVGVVCLATSTSKVHVCLDLNGVEAAWLPSKRSRSLMLDEEAEDLELLLFETVDLAVSGTDDESWPTFTPSASDRYEPVSYTHLTLPTKRIV